MTPLMLALLFAAAPQTPAPAGPPATVVPSPAPADALQAESEPSTYSPDGRRDPFVSLVGRGSEPAQRAHIAGLPGLLVNEVTVKGVIRDRNGFLAMLQAPDSKTYIVRSGDKLMDGGVKSITPDGVVFAQDVNDPLSLVKQREVPKRVRAIDARQ